MRTCCVEQKRHIQSIDLSMTHKRAFAHFFETVQRGRRQRLQCGDIDDIIEKRFGTRRIEFDRCCCNTQRFGALCGPGPHSIVCTIEINGVDAGNRSNQRKRIRSCFRADLISHHHQRSKREIERKREKKNGKSG